MTSSAAISASWRCQQPQQVCISYGHCGAMPSGRSRSPTALPSARAKTPQQHQQALQLLRAMPRPASVLDVLAYGAAISVGGKYRQHQQAYISRVRCGAMPSCRL